MFGFNCFSHGHAGLKYPTFLKHDKGLDVQVTSGGRDCGDVVGAFCRRDLFRHAVGEAGAQARTTALAALLAVPLINLWM